MNGIISGWLMTTARVRANVPPLPATDAGMTAAATGPAEATGPNNKRTSTVTPATRDPPSRGVSHQADREPAARPTRLARPV